MTAEEWALVAEEPCITGGVEIVRMLNACAGHVSTIIHVGGEQIEYAERPQMTKPEAYAQLCRMLRDLRETDQWS